MKTDAARRVARTMYHGQSRDGLAVLEQSCRPPRAGHDESGQPWGQAVRQAPQRHPFPRPARLQVGCVGRVDGETRAGCLAEGERGTRVIDVVVREDDPIDPAQGLCLDEAKDGAEAAGITGVDNGKTVAALVQIGLRAANAWNPADHTLIMAGAFPDARAAR